MCIEDSCVPYCARNISDPICKGYGKSPKSNEPEETGDMCVNVEYDGDYVPERWEPKSCGGGSTTRGDDCGHAIPAHVEKEDENICVDVYDDNVEDATARLNELVEQKVKDNNWQNVKYYCMSGATQLFMSIFQPDSLAYSDKYCGRATEEAAAEPAVEEENSFSLWEGINSAFEAQRETRDIFRKQCDAGSWAGCFNLSSMSAKL